MAEEFCEMCELPLSTCIHGMPAPLPAPVAAPTARASRAATTRKTAATRKPAARKTSSTPSPVRKRTEQEAFRPFILRVLQDEGSLETADVMARLEERMSEVLLERDRQTAPTGEIRWQTAARAERKAMIDEGLIFAAQPGIWQLTERGRLSSS